MGIIDSLHVKLKGTEGLQRYDLLNAIGFEYRYSYPDSTIYYCTQAFNLGKQLDLTKNLSRPLSFIGLAYNNQGEYKKSLEYHEQAIEIAIQQKDSIQLGHSYNNLGRMFLDGGDQVRAINNLFRAKEIFEALDDKPGLAYAYRSLATVYKTQGEFINAIDMSDKAYKIRLKLGDKRTITSSLTELGLIYQTMGDMPNALDKFSQAEVIAEQIDDKVIQAEVLMAIAEIQFFQGKLDEALEHAGDVLNTITETTNQRLFIRAYLLKAKYAIKKNQDSQAIPVLEKVLQLTRKSGNMAYQLEALKLASESFKKIGRSDLASQYMDEYALISEKQKNTGLLREIDRLEFQLMIEKIEAENKLLKADQLASMSVINQQRFQNVILIIAALSFLVLSAVLVMVNQKRKVANIKLAENNEKIKQQQNAIEETNQMLMARNVALSELNNEKDSLMSIVAHDLKAPLNRITGLVTLIELNQGLNTEQKEYINMIRSVTKGSTDLIADLLDATFLNETNRQPAETVIDLNKLIESKIKSFQLAAESKSIQIQYNHSITESFQSVSDYIERIVDNLLSNAIKFSSRNATVVINAATADEFATISIKDQGPGFSDDDRQYIFQRFKRLSARPTGGESSNGLGLAIVKTLVDRLHGTITLNSKPDEGAEFVVRLPIKNTSQTSA